MHELPMVMRLLGTLEQKAAENDVKRITRIELKIGELSDLVDECIQVYFDSASENTVCEGAELVFTKEPAMLRCSGCGREFPHIRSFNCPECGAEANLIRGTGSGYEIVRFSCE